MNLIKLQNRSDIIVSKQCIVGVVLQTCVVRAWDPKKPLLFAPAMNTLMLQHPITQPQINVLVSWGHIEIPTCSKKLACGDVGYGAMAEVDTIAEKVIQHLSNLSK